MCVTLTVRMTKGECCSRLRDVGTAAQLLLPGRRQAASAFLQ